MQTLADKNRHARKPVVLGLLALLLSVRVQLPAASGPSDPWASVRTGLDHFYNLEYEEALADFRHALTLQPETPLFLNYSANAYLFQELYRTGQLDTQLYSESNPFLEAVIPKTDPKAMQAVKDLLRRSKEICTERLRENPHDTASLYALGIAYGIEANYEFTLAKGWFAALRAGIKAKDFHMQLKRLDPDNHDAELVLGLYDYTAGSIPARIKWLAFLFGHRGSKQRGIELLRAAMTQGRLVSADATTLLALVYSRERRYAEARALFQKLAQEYPRNHLLPQEIARTYLQEGNEQAALVEYARVAEKVGKGAPGFDRVPRDRLYYQIGSLHQRLQNYQQALAAFDKITASSEADSLLSAYSSVRKGEIFLALNRPEEARRECERVLTMPYTEPRAHARRVLQRVEKSQP